MIPSVGKRPRTSEPATEDFDEDDELVALAYAAQPGYQLEHGSKLEQRQDHGSSVQPDQQSSPSKAAAACTSGQVGASSRAGLKNDGGKKKEAESYGALQAAAVFPARNAADIEGECMTVTSNTGERVYCGLAAPDAGQILRPQHQKRQGHFLEKPISALMAEVGKHSQIAALFAHRARHACTNADDMLSSAVQVEQAAYESALNAPLEGEQPASASAAESKAEMDQVGVLTKHNVSLSFKPQESSIMKSSKHHCPKNHCSMYR